jgi:hypothetical protein
MQGILEEDDDVLLHESVHLTRSQIKRASDGLHDELIFLERLPDHLDEEKASQAEARLNRTLNPDDILRLKLWSQDLVKDTEALRAARLALRESWICETQAYYVQLLVLDRRLKRQETRSLKAAADRLRQTLISETGLSGQEDMALTLFQSFNPRLVTEGFQEAVLPCVLMNAHSALLFQTLAETSGWDIQKAGKDPAYHRRLFAWARQKILRWNALTAGPPDEKNQT